MSLPAVETTSISKKDVTVSSSLYTYSTVHCKHTFTVNS